jgi:hypothetical protein
LAKSDRLLVRIMIGNKKAESFNLEIDEVRLR